MINVITQVEAEYVVLTGNSFLLNFTMANIACNKKYTSIKYKNISIIPPP